MEFTLSSPFAPTGDQPECIGQLTRGIQGGKQKQVLLGVTGSGKTYTIANVIANVQKPTLVIAHNKTLAAQLYQEFRDFFPNNAVSYFVSYYDYYQPEAYIPSTDTYIEKETEINDEIDKLRLAATTNLLTRPDSIVIASVSCIYNLGSPVEYGKYILRFAPGEVIPRQSLLLQLTNLQYERNDTDLHRGSFRVRGESIQVWPAYENTALMIEMLGNSIETIHRIDPVSGQRLEQLEQEYILYPAKHYMMDPKSQGSAIAQIEQDLQTRISELKSRGKVLEAYRLEQKVHYDLGMMTELGFVNGIENYSRYFDGRSPGDPPYTLLDYFAHNAKQFGTGSFLTVIDESHITVPQIRGMYNGDQARKQVLIDYGFRLPSALDNRPLKFDEFMGRTQDTIFVSATPSVWEMSISNHEVAEQLIRPTGVVEPAIDIRPSQGQVENLIGEIIARKQKSQRVLVTTLTKRMAEALTEYLNDEKKMTSAASKVIPESSSGQAPESGLQDSSLPAGRQVSGIHQYLPKVAYLHSDIETLDRSDILDDLRRGVYDVLVGINLLREGLDLPEVTLVAILDADKEGFLRSTSSLIQIMGRAARHEEGRVILYADKVTGSMQGAIDEVNRRREKQLQYNKEHGITPLTIRKPIREQMIKRPPKDEREAKKTHKASHVVLGKNEDIDLASIDAENMLPVDRQKLTRKLTRVMNTAAKDWNFELATTIRDAIAKLDV